ncbi:hypothetical protein ADUPG1_000160, partial [Aduncisulcus paluster]
MEKGEGREDMSVSASTSSVGLMREASQADVTLLSSSFRNIRGRFRHSREMIKSKHSPGFKQKQKDPKTTLREELYRKEEERRKEAEKKMDEELKKRQERAFAIERAEREREQEEIRQERMKLRMKLEEEKRQHEDKLAIDQRVQLGQLATQQWRRFDERDSTTTTATVPNTLTAVPNTLTSVSTTLNNTLTTTTCSPSHSRSQQSYSQIHQQTLSPLKDEEDDEEEEEEVLQKRRGEDRGIVMDTHVEEGRVIVIDAPSTPTPLTMNPTSRPSMSTIQDDSISQQTSQQVLEEEDEELPREIVVADSEMDSVASHGIITTEVHPRQPQDQSQLRDLMGKPSIIETQKEEDQQRQGTYEDEELRMAHERRLEALRKIREETTDEQEERLRERLRTLRFEQTSWNKDPTRIGELNRPSAGSIAGSRLQQPHRDSFMDHQPTSSRSLASTYSIADDAHETWEQRWVELENEEKRQNSQLIHRMKSLGTKTEKVKGIAHRGTDSRRDASVGIKTHVEDGEIVQDGSHDIGRIRRERVIEQLKERIRRSDSGIIGPGVLGSGRGGVSEYDLLDDAEEEHVLGDSPILRERRRQLRGGVEYASSTANLSHSSRFGTSLGALGTRRTSASGRRASIGSTSMFGDDNSLRGRTNRSGSTFSAISNISQGSTIVGAGRRRRSSSAHPRRGYSAGGASQQHDRSMSFGFGLTSSDLQVADVPTAGEGIGSADTQGDVSSSRTTLRGSRDLSHSRSRSVGPIASKSGVKLRDIRDFNETWKQLDQRHDEDMRQVKVAEKADKQWKRIKKEEKEREEEEKQRSATSGSTQTAKTDLDLFIEKQLKQSTYFQMLEEDNSATARQAEQQEAGKKKRKVQREKLRKQREEIRKLDSRLAELRLKQNTALEEVKKGATPSEDEEEAADITQDGIEGRIGMQGQDIEMYDQTGTGAAGWDYLEQQMVGVPKSPSSVALSPTNKGDDGLSLDLSAEREKLRKQREEIRKLDSRLAELRLKQNTALEEVKKGATPSEDEEEAADITQDGIEGRIGMQGQDIEMYDQTGTGAAGWDYLEQQMVGVPKSPSSVALSPTSQYQGTGSSLSASLSSSSSDQLSPSVVSLVVSPHLFEKLVCVKEGLSSSVKIAKRWCRIDLSDNKLIWAKHRTVMAVDKPTSSSGAGAGLTGAESGFLVAGDSMKSRGGVVSLNHVKAVYLGHAASAIDELVINHFSAICDGKKSNLSRSLEAGGRIMSGRAAVAMVEGSGVLDKAIREQKKAYQSSKSLNTDCLRIGITTSSRHIHLTAPDAEVFCAWASALAQMFGLKGVHMNVISMSTKGGGLGLPLEMVDRRIARMRGLRRCLLDPMKAFPNMPQFLLSIEDTGHKMKFDEYRDILKKIPDVETKTTREIITAITQMIKQHETTMRKEVEDTLRDCRNRPNLPDEAVKA